MTEISPVAIQWAARLREPLSESSGRRNHRDDPREKAGFVEDLLNVLGRLTSIAPLDRLEPFLIRASDGRWRVLVARGSSLVYEELGDETLITPLPHSVVQWIVRLGEWDAVSNPEVHEEVQDSLARATEEIAKAFDELPASATIRRKVRAGFPFSDVVADLLIEQAEETRALLEIRLNLDNADVRAQAVEDLFVHANAFRAPLAAVSDGNIVAWYSVDFNTGLAPLDTDAACRRFFASLKR